jgi:hypothetical protein
MSEHENKNTTVAVSIDRITKAVAAAVESFDIEVARLNKEDEAVKVMSFFENLYRTTNLYSFYVPVNLTETTNHFLTDTTLRAFLLNYIERVSMSFAVKELSYDNIFLDLLVSHITLAKTHPESAYSLINKEVLDSLYVNPEVLKSLLKDNFWLTVLYLLLVNFQLSTVFKAYTKEA